MDVILSWTNLPNLHPAFVHFPIVLLAVALLADTFAFFAGSEKWLRKSALFLYVLGSLSTAATFWTGRQAADTVLVPAEAQSILAEHEDLALYTLIFFGVYAVLRLAAHLSGMTERNRFIHALLVLLSLGGQALVYATADHGGALVFKHGVAVQRPQPVKPSSAPVVEVAAGPVIDGNHISWTFGPGSEKRVNEFLETFQGTVTPEQLKTESIDDRTFLVVERNEGKPLGLVFKNIYGSVQVEAEIDTGGFPGKIALIHHAGTHGYDFFSISERDAVLGRETGGKLKKLAGEKIDIPEGFVTIKAVAVNGHFRGYVGDKLVVHGHARDAPTGKAGIWIEGTGTVRIHRIAISPLGEGH